MNKLESLIEDAIFANDDDAVRRACQAIYVLGQNEARLVDALNEEIEKKESVEHLLTVLRGKMQSFEETQDHTNQAEEWDKMLEYLQTWIEEDRANRK